MRIRAGNESDLPRALELIVELAVYEKQPEEVVNTVEMMQVDGFGENPVFGFFVAEDSHHRIVGLALYYWRYSTWKGKRLYLEDLVVTQSARGQGYGKALFERTLEYGREQGATGMVWQVLDWNQPAIDFYKSYGSKIESGWLNCNLEIRHSDPSPTARAGNPCSRESSD